jgi:hypothetical protein
MDPGILSRQSPPELKIALFGSLFKITARTPRDSVQLGSLFAPRSDESM